MMDAMCLFFPEFARRVQAEHDAEEKRTYGRLKNGLVPEVWDEEKTRFVTELFLRADSWEPDCLFDVPPMTGKPGERLDENTVVWCPGTERRFLYANHVLPEGT